MHIEKIPIGRINSAPYNPRKDLRNGDPEYQKLLRSLDEFGCVEPLVWNRRTGNLVGGHQRLKILSARGDKEILCTIVDLPTESEKALNLALNKVSGAWDQDRLAVLLDELIDEPNFDFEVTGFEPPEAARLIDDILIPDDSGEERLDLDSQLRRAGKPVTRRGEIIELGPHRLLCGDGTKSNHMSRLLGGSEPDLIFTDPPCGVYHAATKDEVRVPKDLPRSLVGLLRVILHMKCKAKYVCGQWQVFADYVNVLGPPTNVIVWNRPQQSSSRVRGRNLHLRNSLPAFIFYYGRKKRKAGLFEEAVWSVPDVISTGHPTLKPIDLCIRAIRNSSSKEDIVFDPFLGCGSTLVAAEKLGRRCFGLEIDPKYCDCAARRYIAVAGNRAVCPELIHRYGAGALNVCTEHK